MALTISELIELTVIWSVICCVGCFFELRAENKKLKQENKRLKKCLK